MEGTKKIIDECWRIVNNPDKQEQGYKIAALHISLEGNAKIAQMLKSMKELYFPSGATTDHNSDYDYVP